MKYFRGIPCTREGLVWRRAHEIKRMLDPTTATGIRLWVHYYELVNQKRARA